MKYNKVKGVLKSKRSAFVLTLFCAMAVSLFLLGAPTNVAADEVDGEAELIAAIEGATPGTPLTIEFKGDISLSLVTTLVIPAGTDITLTGNYSLIGVSGYPTITVEGTLTIDGITVTHPTGVKGNGVLNKGTFTFVTGTISGNTATDGGGVYNNGTFNMSDGAVISGNDAPRGGGVYNIGTFNMSGGTIDANTSYYDGGGVYNITTFKMSGGKITNNVVSNRGGGGVYNSGTFEMTGGSISFNSADGGGGVLNYRTFNMSGNSVISYNTSRVYGGGIHNNGSAGGGDAVFNMTGGTISNNKTGSGGYGAGVCNAYATSFFNMSGTALITGNSSPNGFGAGVCNWVDAVFNMTGGTISDNSAAYGGGVLEYYNSVFYMSDGTISGNKASYYGGGVMNWQDSTFNLSGGTISGNKASYYGGGVANWANDSSNPSTFTMSGGTISDNAASYGGGLYINNLAVHTISINKGTFSNNSAASLGGGIWVHYDYLYILNIAADVIFTGNSAEGRYEIADADKATYQAHVFSTSWTYPFTQGYNNYDISYNRGIELLTVIFMRNHDGSDSTIVASVFVGKGAAIGAKMPSVPSRAGYDFIEWNASKDGSGTTYDVTSAVNGKLTLYAQWELKHAVTVTFDKNTTDASVKGPDPATKTVTFEEKYGTLAHVSRNGYAFGGWYLTPGCTGSVITLSSIVADPGDHTLYAKWVVHKTDASYIVHYYLQGTTTSIAPDKIVHGKAVGAHITENAIAVSGYVAVNPTTKDIFLSSSVNVITFYYSEGAHTVTVNGSFAETTGAGTYDQGVTVSIDSGVREGFIFGGWKVISGGVALADTGHDTTVFDMPGNDVVLLAKWELDHGLGGIHKGIGDDHNGLDDGTGESWSLVNLMFCIIGAAFAVFALTAHFNKDRETKLIWLIVAIVMGIAGVVLFFLTENMDHVMEYVDDWTIANAAVLILGMLSVWLAIRKKTTTVN